MTIGHIDASQQLLLDLQRAASAGTPTREEKAGFARILAAAAGSGMQGSALGMLGGDSRPLAEAFRMSGLVDPGFGLAAAGFPSGGTMARIRYEENRAPVHAISSASKTPRSEARESAATPAPADETMRTDSAEAMSSPAPPAISSANSKRALGFLSARFESASAGVAAIGYDPSGGTSYGTFQIASKPGTMEEFLRFLDRRAPEWAERLRAAGPADTGSRSGKMPRVWREIASESPERFDEIQREFVRNNHFEPARRWIRERTGLDIGTSGRAVQEVVFSTAVQHGAGGAAGIVAEAVSEGGTDDAALIRKIYEIRGDRFREHPPDLAAGIARRFASESAAAEALRRVGVG